MTTHKHPELESEILEVSQSLTSETGASEDRLLAAMAELKDELKSDIAGLETSIAGLSTRMDSLETTIAGLSSRMDSLETNMGRVIAWIERQGG